MQGLLINHTINSIVPTVEQQISNNMQKGMILGEGHPSIMKTQEDIMTRRQSSSRPGIPTTILMADHLRGVAVEVPDMEAIHHPIVPGPLNIRQRFLQQGRPTTAPMHPPQAKYDLVI